MTQTAQNKYPGARIYPRYKVRPAMVPQWRNVRTIYWLRRSEAMFRSFPKPDADLGIYVDLNEAIERAEREPGRWIIEHFYAIRFGDEWHRVDFYQFRLSEDATVPKQAWPWPTRRTMKKIPRKAK